MAHRSPRTPARAALRSLGLRLKRSRYARHFPFVTYVACTVAWVGWYLTTMLAR